MEQLADIDIAHRTGVSRSVISDIINRKLQPSARTMQRLAPYWDLIKAKRIPYTWQINK